MKTIFHVTLVVLSAAISPTVQQWGYLMSNGITSGTISYPIAFKIFSDGVAVTSNAAITIGVYNHNTAGFTFYTTATKSDNAIRWIAVGV